METVFASAARTATANSADISSRGYAGGIFFVNVSAVSGTSPSMTLNIQHKDPLSGQYKTIGSSAAITATGTTMLVIYPGIAGVANTNFNNILGEEFRINATITGTSPSFTFSVSFDGVR